MAKSVIAVMRWLLFVALVVLNVQSSSAQSDRFGGPQPQPQKSRINQRVAEPPRVIPDDEPEQVASNSTNSQVDSKYTEPADQMISPATAAVTLKMAALITVMGLVPSIAMMTTCFVRFSVVLGLLRQALGIPQALPNQMTTALGLFMTILVMSPVWQRSYEEGIRPYLYPTEGANRIDELTAFQRATGPLHAFMSRQIDRAGNADAVWMFVDFLRPDEQSPGASKWREPQSYDDISLTVLIPAYMLSELKVAFIIGFQLFLPFLIIDLVVASILTAVGMQMLPPSLVSLPFKLLLFVLIDGWFLTVGMLLESVRAL